MHAKIKKMLFSVVDELNQLLPPEEQLEKNLDAPVAGDAGKLDSAGLINLIVVTEQKAAEDLGVPILLTDDETLSRVNQIFGTLGTLCDHIHLLMNAKTDA